MGGLAPVDRLYRFAVSEHESEDYQNGTGHPDDSSSHVIGKAGRQREIRYAGFSRGYAHKSGHKGENSYKFLHVFFPLPSLFFRTLLGARNFELPDMTTRQPAAGLKRSVR